MASTTRSSRSNNVSLNLTHREVERLIASATRGEMLTYDSDPEGQEIVEKLQASLKS